MTLVTGLSVTRFFIDDSFLLSFLILAFNEAFGNALTTLRFTTGLAFARSLIALRAFEVLEVLVVFVARVTFTDFLGATFFRPGE